MLSPESPPASVRKTPTTWQGIVHVFRLFQGVDLAKLNLDVWQAISRISENPQESELNKLRILMLLRVAVKEAYYPDQMEDNPKIRYSEYIRPLKNLGFWNDNNPLPWDALSPEQILELANLSHAYPLPHGKQNSLSDVRDSLVGNRQAFIRTATMQLIVPFWPYNAAALVRETPRINLLLDRAEKAGLLRKREAA